MSSWHSERKGYDPRTFMLVHEDGRELDLKVCGCSSEDKARFVEFTEVHPNFIDDVIRTALELQGRGYERAGVRMILEGMRWNVLLATDPAMWKELYPDDYKIPNQIMAYVARKVMKECPELFGFFKLGIIKCKTCGYGYEANLSSTSS